MNRFNKGEDIKTEGKEFTCIVCDEEFATFCELIRTDDGGFSINMENIFVVSNLKDFEDGFKYKLSQKEAA